MANKFDTSGMPKQRQFMNSTRREILYSGAFGAGKSRVGCEKGLFLSLNYPGNVGAVVRKVFASLRITTMETWVRDVCPPELMDGPINQMTNILRLTNGSKVIFTGLDDPQKIGSLEVGWIFIDEAVELDEDDYIMLLGRLRLTELVTYDERGRQLRAKLPIRQIFCATNPASNLHWLYQRAYVNGSMEVIESNALENVHTPDDYKESLQAFKGIYYDRYVMGKWVGASGLVYDCFDPKEHVVDNFDIPKNWRRYRSIDFGFTNPFVCLWIAEHPEVDDPDKCKCPAPVHGGFYVYQEIYMSQRVVEEHAGDIKYNSKQEYYKYTFADWAAGDRATLELHGVPTIQADKSVSAGIQSVYNLLANGRLHVFKDTLIERDYSLEDDKGVRKPQSILDEFGVYKYPAAPSGKQSKLANNKEEPIDKDNHAMDALRYCIHTLALRNLYVADILAPSAPSPFQDYKVETWKLEGIFAETGRTRWNA